MTGRSRSRSQEKSGLLKSQDEEEAELMRELIKDMETEEDLNTLRNAYVELKKRQEEENEDEVSDIQNPNLSATYLWLIVIGVLLRVLCSFWAFGFVSSRPELTSPLVSYGRLEDGIAMYRDGISPYLGDSFHFQPVVLKLFSLLIFHGSSVVSTAMFLSVDCMTALLLSLSALSFATENKRKDGPQLAAMVMTCYMLNPITISSASINSLSVMYNFILAAFVYFFSSRNHLLSVLTLALSVHLSLYPVVLLFCLFLRFPSLSERVLSVVLLLISCAVLFGLNWILNGQKLDFFDATYGFMVRVDDLTPNAGIFWYFFTQVFEHFRVFYLAVFQINLLIYVVPLVLSIRNDDHLHLLISLLLIAVFSPYPTLNDASVYLSLLPLMDKYKKYQRYSLLIAGTIVTCIVLMPVMWHMWIVIGSGNANFYFAVTIIYNIAQIYILIDFMFAYFRSEAENVSKGYITETTKFVFN